MLGSNNALAVVLCAVPQTVPSSVQDFLRGPVSPFCPREGVRTGVRIGARDRRN